MAHLDASATAVWSTFTASKTDTFTLNTVAGKGCEFLLVRPWTLKQSRHCHERGKGLECDRQGLVTWFVSEPLLQYWWDWRRWVTEPWTWQTYLPWRLKVLPFINVPSSGRVIWFFELDSAAYPLEFLRVCRPACSTSTQRRASAWSAFDNGTKIWRELILVGAVLYSKIGRSFKSTGFYKRPWSSFSGLELTFWHVRNLNLLLELGKPLATVGGFLGTIV